MGAEMRETTRNYILRITFLFFLIILKTNSQEKMDLVQTEYAFAEATKNSTVREGFLQFIADDGVLFRPGPVNGKEFLENSEAQPGLLLWYPTASFISSSGDLGVNTGPWEFKRTAEDEPAAFGQFLTVWEKQSDGTWKFLIDLGIGHPKPEETKEGIENSIVLDKPNSSKNYDDILQIEKGFNSASLNENYKLIVNDKTTFLRNNRLPINNEMKDEFLSQLSGTVQWETLGGKSSEANDLAYTYGKGTALDNQMNAVYEFYYIHVWINYNGNWKLLYDVVSEIAGEE
jgi:ketosteroid isomerase-like protein